jgi:hypothetical protein
MSIHWFLATCLICKEVMLNYSRNMHKSPKKLKVAQSSCGWKQLGIKATVNIRTLGIVSLGSRIVHSNRSRCRLVFISVLMRSCCGTTPTWPSSSPTLSPQTAQTSCLISILRYKHLQGSLNLKLRYIMLAGASVKSFLAQPRTWNFAPSLRQFVNKICFPDLFRGG